MKLPNPFQPIEFSLSKFDNLDPTYQTSKARIRQNRKDSEVNFKTLNFLDDTSLKENYYDFVFDRGCIHGMIAENITKFSAKVSKIISNNGLWMSIIGSCEGPEVYNGPPRRTCSEMIGLIEPHMKIVNVFLSKMIISNNHELPK